MRLRTVVLPGRSTARAQGEVVVFLIGMRVNHFRAPHRWAPVMAAMPMMLRELKRDRSAGLLHHVLLTASPRTYYVVQYWESLDKLLEYARSTGGTHRRWWGRLNRWVRKGGSHVGIWHETYVVPAGSHEAIYADMPAFGLGRAYGVEPLDGTGARERLAGAAAGR